MGKLFIQAGSVNTDKGTRLTSVGDILSGMLSSRSPLAKGFRNWKAKQNNGKDLSHGE